MPPLTKRPFQDADLSGDELSFEKFLTAQDKVEQQQLNNTIIAKLGPQGGPYYGASLQPPSAYGSVNYTSVSRTAPSTPPVSGLPALVPRPVHEG